MALGETLGSGPGTTKLLLHLNGDAVDSSGNGNNGLRTNVADAPGKVGNLCASFPGGSNAAKIDIGSSLTLGNNYTFSFWVNIQSQNGQYIYDATTSTPRCLFYENLSSGGTNKWGFYLNNALIVDPGLNGIMDFGIWTKITVVYDSSQATKKIVVYKNGVEFASFNITLSNSTWVPRFGNRYTSLGTSCLNGKLDEFVFENISWGSIKVQKDYTNSIGRFAIL